MDDYLQPVGDRVRRVAAVACFCASLVAGSMTGLVVTGMVQRRQFDHDGKPLWAGAAVCGLIAVACGWLSARLWAGQSANGVTILPVWFIELFGAVFLAGAVWVGVEYGLIWGGSTAAGVVIAMLFVRQAVRKRRAGFTD